VKVGISTSQPISCAVTSLLTGANRCPMIASNPSTASDPKPPVIVSPSAFSGSTPNGDGIPPSATGGAAADTAKTTTMIAAPAPRSNPRSCRTPRLG
jgi:hypothetical protein